MKKICECTDNNITEDFIDARHTIFSNSIVVKNTPILVCNKCSQSEYKDPQLLYSLLKDAYRNSRTIINYSEGN